MPVLYVSRSHKESKRQWSMMGLKALAVVWAVEMFRLIIMGTCFKAVTNHNALKAFVNKTT